ncbi:MAG: exodeoxyribonuclease VII large subunit [Gemmataceae bacterium]|nr:exodeoxyribonuclease VII large subunit [Gemmataceae bacterium]
MDLFSQLPIEEFFTVTQINEETKALLEGAYRSLWILGEISDLKTPNSGHAYFSLKDEKCSIRGVLFKPNVLKAGKNLREGMKVLIRGRLSIYAARGDFQFIGEEVRPFGIGDQDLALKQLKEKLRGKGYFSQERKKSLPNYPRRIALVTSPTGSAVRDMLEVLRKRWPGAEVLLAPVRVQGDLAPGEISLALNQLNSLSLFPGQEIDLILLGRGGGSSEDLGAFNSEIVANAIFQSYIPVVSAVGHEDDLTIADLVADRRALTPTEAATMATPDFQEIIKELGNNQTYLNSSLKGKLNQASQTLNLLTQRRVFLSPLDLLGQKNQELDELATRFLQSLWNHIKEDSRQLANYSLALESLGPLRILGRGYSLTYHSQEGVGEKKLALEAKALKPGDCLSTILKRGKVFSQVIRVED